MLAAMMTSSWNGVRSCCLGLALVSLLTVPAYAQSRTLSYDDYYRIRDVGSTAISPDGSTVAYVQSQVDEAENRSRSALFLVATDGRGEPRRLTAEGDEESSPRWSPDGRLLLFDRRSSVEGRSGTWLLPTGGGEPFRLEGLEGDPVFDPTNRWIAFTREVPPEGEPPSGPDLTEEERKIVERFDGRSYDWMQFRFDRRGYLPDPTDPFATPPSQIFLLPREGGSPRQLTGLDVDASDIAWHPDGTALVFVADEHQRDEHTYSRADLWTVDLEGRVTRLTDDAFDWGDPTWAPGGDRIVAR
ncbi:MAG TPA: hypothetical protein VLA43_19770, partial [Longimicrobiales bacterium]|nr:hypothetical protein [Longimicrobiales bacterium]